jgi:apolipoprotein N-acyltransferase
MKMKTRLIWQAGLSIISGVLLAFAFPSWDISWLAWIAFVPVLAGLLIWRGSALILLAQGALFSATYSLITFSWLGAEARWSELAQNVGTQVAMGAVWGWMVGKCGLLPEFRKEQSGRKKSLEPILVGPGRSAEAWAGSGAHLRLAALAASTWTALEWARGFLLPVWNGAGLPVAGNLALLQLTKVVGPTGLTFMVVFANTIILANIRRFILQPGRMNWAGRFDVTASLAILLLVAAAGFWSLRSAPEPKGLKVCVVSSTATDLERLTDLSLIAPVNHCDLVVWRRTQLHGGDYQVLAKASLGQTISLIAGMAGSSDAPLSGYSVFAPGSVRSVLAFARQPLFQLLASQSLRNDQPITCKDAAVLPFLGQDAGSLERFRAAVQKQIQCFVVLIDQPAGVATEEEQLKQNVRLWAVALGRPMVFDSRRAGALLMTSSGRVTGSIGPEIEGAKASQIDPPIGVDSSYYAIYGDWFPIAMAVLALFLATSEGLKKFYAESRRFHP